VSIPNQKPLPVSGVLQRFAIEELRHIVRSFANVNESFNQRFTLTELVTIHRCWMASGWDIYPDKWTPLQVAEALRGIIPSWDEYEAPRFPSPRNYLAKLAQ
jgi:hypothetical protein